MNKNNSIESFLTTKNCLFFLFLIFPISILLGSFVINLNILIVSLIFLFCLILKKIKHIYNDKIFLVLVFFLISLLINLIFSNNINLSFPRVIKFAFIIFFIFSFRYCLKILNEDKINKIYQIWSIIFIFVVFDLTFEFFNGTNIIGLESIMPNVRLGSFTGKESVIGNYFYGFVLISLSYFQNNYPHKKYLNLFLAIFFILVAFFIGERSNFIRAAIIIILFILFIHDFKLKNKIYTFLLMSTFLAAFIINLDNDWNLKQNYKDRYFDQVSIILQKDGISKFLNSSRYGAHYNVAKEIFLDNKIFGVGIKNFRVESGNSRYDNLDHPRNEYRVATHPHQLHYEFLSETGIFGYLSFLIFVFFSLYWSIKNYIINKNIYQFSSILFVLVSLLPLLPSGSFLSTYTSSIFWLNYAIMVGYNDLKN